MLPGFVVVFLFCLGFFVFCFLGYMIDIPHMPQEPQSPKVIHGLLCLHPASHVPPNQQGASRAEQNPLQPASLEQCPSFLQSFSYSPRAPQYLRLECSALLQHLTGCSVGLAASSPCSEFLTVLSSDWAARGFQGPSLLRKASH